MRGAINWKQTFASAFKVPYIGIFCGLAIQNVNRKNNSSCLKFGDGVSSAILRDAICLVETNKRVGPNGMSSLITQPT